MGIHEVPDQGAIEALIAAATARTLTDVAATTTTAGALVIGKHNPVDATAGNLSMTLADAPSAGLFVSFEKTDASVNTVVATGFIRSVAASSTTALLSQNETRFLVSKADGSWWPIASLRTNAAVDAAADARVVAGITGKANLAIPTLYTTVQTNTGYTIPAGAKYLFYRGSSAGSGGGSGRRGLAGTIRCAGGGGGAGGYFENEVLVSTLTAAGIATLYVTIGAKGTGGAAVTTDDTSGNTGTAGGLTTLATTTTPSFITDLGQGGGSTGGTGGSATSGLGGAGGVGRFGNYGGGGSASTTGLAGGTAATLPIGTMTGGTAGGGLSSANVASAGGNNYGAVGVYYTVIGGGAATGANGFDSVVHPYLVGPTQGTSGGGSGTGAGGRGGHALRGGGGSGGAASLNGNNSGAGGDGGDGWLEIVAYF